MHMVLWLYVVNFSDDSLINSHKSVNLCANVWVKFLVIAILIANFVAKQIAKLSATQITELNAVPSVCHTDQAK